MKLRGKTTKKSSVSVSTFLLVLSIFSLSILARSSDAFSISPAALKPSRTTSFSSSGKISDSLRRFDVGANGINDLRSSSSRTGLSMYNLPPGGGGGKNEIADIAKGAFSILLTIAFFLSPLGRIVLGLFNSFLVLLIVLPLVGTVAFQVWQKLNTVQAPCPVCGVTTTVIKSNDDLNVIETNLTSQSICFSCGAVLQANEDNTGINNVSGRKTIDDLNKPMGPRSSIFDILTTNEWPSGTSTTTENSFSNINKESVGIDKNAAIDVDVLDEEKPFQ